MDRRFDKRRKLVYVSGVLTGPHGETVVKMAIDTGAARSVIRPSMLHFVGYDPANSPHRSRLISATGDQLVAFVSVESLKCIGQKRLGMYIAAHELPRRFEGDGLLGLDFFRDDTLTIDFFRGLVNLRRPRPRWQFWH